MSAYYNEIDPFAAQWLRNLIAADLIAPGDVDERSIVDVSPDDLAGYTQAHFFAGIGVWSHALRLAGWPDDREVWTGSCPCQPFSAIGKHEGERDERHLWPVFARLITERRPPAIFGEQVAGRAGRGWLAGVRADLEGARYALGAADLCAASVTSPHRRQRLYWVADAGRTRLEGHAGNGDDGHEPGWLEAKPSGSVAAAGPTCTDASGVAAVSVLRGLHVHDPRRARARLRVSGHRGMGGPGDGPVWARFEPVACADGWRRVEPGTFPLATGAPARVGRLRGYGNAINAEVAAAFIRAYREVRP